MYLVYYKELTYADSMDSLSTGCSSVEKNILINTYEALLDFINKKDLQEQYELERKTFNSLISLGESTVGIADGSRAKAILDSRIVLNVVKLEE